MYIYDNGNTRGYVGIAHIRYLPDLYAKRDVNSNTRGYVGTAHDDSLRHAYPGIQLRHSRVQELRGCVVASIETTVILFYSWFAAHACMHGMARARASTRASTLCNVTVTEFYNWLDRDFEFYNSLTD